MRFAGLTLAAGLMLPGICRAQSASDSVGWHFTGALGYVQTSGNTRLSTVNVSDKLLYRPGSRWLFTQTAAWVYGKTSGVESANQLVLSVRSDYNMHPRLSLYALVGYERNRFAGISRRTQESVGLSWWAVKSARTELQLDVGGGFEQERNGDTTGFSIARIAPRYRYTFKPNAYFEEQIEMLANLEATGDLRTMSSTSLVAPLTRNIGIRLGYLMRYDAVPSPGFRKLDTTFTTGIQVTL